MARILFGTDGIRGVANQFPITPDICLKFGMAAAHYFKKDDRRHRVVIAKDTRLSGYMIENALTSGFLAMGMDVILLGPMPTPAVSMLIKSLRADLGVMISASHNKSSDNGLKLFDATGSKLTDDIEEKLEDLILNFDFTKALPSPDNLGRAKRLDDAAGRYVEHVKRSFPKGLSLEGLRIVLDCANGAAYNLAPWIFWELGAEVIKINCEPNGFNINLNCGSLYPEALQAKVLETRADIGIAFDGDADRIIVCDENAKVINGDHIIGLIATELKSSGALSDNAVVVTQMSNSGLDEYLNSIGITVYRTKVGDRYVAEKMSEKNCNLGGEQSGHIILGDYALSGDGIVAALQILAAKIRSKKPTSSFTKLFQLLPQATVNMTFKNKNPLDNPKIIEKIKLLEHSSKDVRYMIRKSGTEKLIRILVEGKDYSRIKKLASEVAEMINGAD